MKYESMLLAGRAGRIWRLFSLAGLFALALGALMVAPAAQAEADRQTCSNNEVGTHNGFFYTMWFDHGTSCIQLKAGGRYALTWQVPNNGNVVAGKGWATSARRTISYSGTYSPGGGGASYLAVYGWTQNPLVEYYIVDNWSNYNPSSGGTFMGTVTTDGDVYDIYKSRRYGAPNITGTNQDFDQYWSVRRTKRTSGTITTGNHFDAWASKGMNLGDFNYCPSQHCYQVLATEGYNNSGSSDLTVSEGTPPPPPTAAVGLINLNSGKALDTWSSNDASPLQQWDYWATDNQKWSIVRGRLPDTWEVRSKSNGKCVSVPSSSTTPGAVLNQWPCYGGTEQLWYQVWINYPQLFQLVNVNSTQCMDVSYGSGANGAAIIQWTCHSGNSQRWSTRP
ncbi:glycoside hydrolase family 11 protein [Pseudoxanthomonas sacheonensis]|uniref:Endo-1,4-beta-xylanase n=1 Tax=Pseudoxanthomonas sacheonensis TaxID=443615 RepID=A0ABU1RWQ8_9GAMM|nr:glycoside hydrolase family 11 protein [Pseudoxanthomonas sacheonensis]MDR6843213.1 endo-1,4-beta-xylanase [Pseudoxanthomonas sacheonensis]